MTTQFEHNLENLKSKLLLMGQLANESLQGSNQSPGRRGLRTRQGRTNKGRGD